MSNKMTPCEKLGYKVGDKFKVVDGTGVHYAVGSFITLIHDDGSSCPRFNGVHAIFGSGDSFFHLDFVEKVAKLRPAKQALADAIHQSGGWIGGLFAIFEKLSGSCIFCENKPHFCREMKGWFVNADSVVGEFDMKPFVNWHQTCLSRDEYSTAYPEQVKVEICNETKQKVEVEMKSESEMTINASDWHKNGELPPAGTWCTLHAKENNGEEVMFIGVTSCNSPVFETVQNMIFVERGEFRFSPLRTERERAIDEMVDVICDNGFLSKDGTESKRIANRLLDAGYRKEVK